MCRREIFISESSERCTVYHHSSTVDEKPFFLLFVFHITETIVARPRSG
jgi:hypothetical protein